MEGEVKGKTFKMKGHTLPGINQRSGENKSSTFQFMGAGFTASQNISDMHRRNPSAFAGGGGGGGGVVTPTDPSTFVSKPSMAKDMKTGKYKQKFER